MSKPNIDKAVKLKAQLSQKSVIKPMQKQNKPFILALREYRRKQRAETVGTLV